VNGDYEIFGSRTTLNVSLVTFQAPGTKLYRKLLTEDGGKFEDGDCVQDYQGFDEPIEMARDQIVQLGK
jgi:hypothetical protein